MRIKFSSPGVRLSLPPRWLLLPTKAKRSSRTSTTPYPIFPASRSSPSSLTTLRAGASPSHTHAKSAFIFAYVVSGAIESQVNDGPKRVYRKGESFFETPGSSHPVSRNASQTEPAKLLAVFIAIPKKKI